MKPALTVLRTAAEAVAAAMMAAMFLTFVLQILIRYSARLGWIAEAVPLLEPSRYGWTLEFCLLLWVWLIFWGNAFVVRDTDHVTFDILYDSVGPGLRRAFLAIGGTAIAAALLLSLEPTWAKFHILRLKKTATLSGFFGDWIRMRHVYAIYILFLAAVSARLLWSAAGALRGRAPGAHHPGPGRRDE